MQHIEGVLFQSFYLVNVGFAVQGGTARGGAVHVDDVAVGALSLFPRQVDVFKGRVAGPCQTGGRISPN